MEQHSDNIENNLSDLHIERSFEEQDDTSLISLNFLDLPYELQTKVFSYLTQKELSLTVAPVCHYWNQLAYDPLFWQKLWFKAVKESALKSICQLLRKATLLKSLTFRASFCNINEIASCSQTFPQLSHLDLGFCNVNSHVLTDFVTNCPQIETLNIEGCSGVFPDCVNKIILLKNLRCLNVSHCKFLTNDCVAKIAQYSTVLEELNIDGITSVNDSAVCSIGNHLQESLKFLALDGEELTDQSFKSLSQCRFLNVLTVSFAEQITDSGILYLKNFNRLRRLRFRRGPLVTSKALSHLFVGNSLQNLTHLELDSLPISDAGIRNLTTCCKFLRCLALPWCYEITDDGLEDIVSNLKFLEWLDLLGLFLIKGCCLIKIPSSLPYLQCLNVEQCNDILDDILLQLVKAKPSLIIYDYYGELVQPQDDDDTDSTKSEDK